MYLFKYLSPEGAQYALCEFGRISLRFDFPRNYNDPCELFLKPDRPLKFTEAIAYHECFLRELPQNPVVCFSKRPDSAVMWAHYGKDASGICLAVDEDVLVSSFDHAFVDDVEYSSAPAQVSAELVEHAATTHKGRHLKILLGIASRAAYFNKRTDWSYEEERRLVVNRDMVRDRNGILLADLPAQCVTAVFVGPEAGSQTREICERWADNAQIECAEMHHGRGNYEPYFTSNRGTRVWDKGTFSEIENSCLNCKEPLGLDQETEYCDECNVTEREIAEIGGSNLLVLTSKLGIRV